MTSKAGGVKERKVVAGIPARCGQIVGKFSHVWGLVRKPGSVALVLSSVMAYANFSFAADQFPNTNPYHHDPSSEDICHECYRRNIEEFRAFVESIQPFKGTQAESLEKVDDFYISRVGLMIHEECFEKEFAFVSDSPMQEFEQMVTDGVIRGFSCLVRGEEPMRERLGAEITSNYNLMPNFLELLTNRSPADQDPVLEANGGSTVALNCETFPLIDNAERFPLLSDCEVVRSIPSLPKIFCSHDTFGELADYNRVQKGARENDPRQFSSRYAEALFPNIKRPIVKNYNNRTKIYTGTAIFINSEKSRNMTAGMMQSWVFHELFHNIGCQHEDKHDENGQVIRVGHNDYAYACQAACFYSEFQNSLKRKGIGPMTAANICFRHDYSEGSHRSARDINHALTWEIESLK